MRNNRLWLETRLGRSAEKVYPTKNLYMSCLISFLKVYHYCDGFV